MKLVVFFVLFGHVAERFDKGEFREYEVPHERPRQRDGEEGDKARGKVGGGGGMAAPWNHTVHGSRLERRKLEPPSRPLGGRVNAASTPRRDPRPKSTTRQRIRQAWRTSSAHSPSDAKSQTPCIRKTRSNYPSPCKEHSHIERGEEQTTWQRKKRDKN